MTYNTTTLGECVRALWARAPWWRFCALSAALLTLLFVLFPPEPHEANPVGQGQATYTPPPVTAGGSAQPTLPAEPPAASPHTADLSLATPDSEANAAIREETGIDPAVLGHLYGGSLKMAGFDVPLPGKHWIMFAQMKLTAPHGEGMAYFLGRVAHRRLMEALVVNALRPKPDDEMAGALSDRVKQFKGLFKAEECNAATPHGCWLVYGLFTWQWGQWGNRNVTMDNLLQGVCN
jgi:hypothetical protein